MTFFAYSKGKGFLRSVTAEVVEADLNSLTLRVTFKGWGMDKVSTELTLPVNYWQSQAESVWEAVIEPGLKKFVSEYMDKLEADG